MSYYIYGVQTSSGINREKEKGTPQNSQIEKVTGGISNILLNFTLLGRLEGRETEVVVLGLIVIISRYITH